MFATPVPFTGVFFFSNAVFGTLVAATSVLYAPL